MIGDSFSVFLLSGPFSDPDSDCFRFNHVTKKDVVFNIDIASRNNDISDIVVRKNLEDVGED